jgi:Mg2+ and Co2+ transporter CorA
VAFRVQQLWQLTPRLSAVPPLPPIDESGVRAFLYDAGAEDRRIELSEVNVAALGDRQLLWIDVDDHAQLDALAASLGIAAETTASITRPTARAAVAFHTDYFHLTVLVPEQTGLGFDAVSLDCVAGTNWILTVRERRVEFLERFDERIRGDSQLGRLDAPALVATFLHEHVAGFVREMEPIELELDRLDLEVMTGKLDDTAVFSRLVNLRRRLSQLRRLFAPHREIYGLLARPDFELLSDSEAHDTFTLLAERAEQAMLTLESTREMIVSSFEIYTTWTAHETNKVMKVLTVSSVTLLPPTLLASVMGMNSLPSPLGTSTAFGLTLTVMLVLSGTVLLLARRRRWI